MDSFGFSMRSRPKRGGVSAEEHEAALVALAAAGRVSRAKVYLSTMALESHGRRIMITDDLRAPVYCPQCRKAISSEDDCCPHCGAATGELARRQSKDVSIVRIYSNNRARFLVQKFLTFFLQIKVD